MVDYQPGPDGDLVQHLVEVELKQELNPVITQPLNMAGHSVPEACPTLKLATPTIVQVSKILITKITMVRKILDTSNSFKFSHLSQESSDIIDLNDITRR